LFLLLSFVVVVVVDSCSFVAVCGSAVSDNQRPDELPHSRGTRLVMLVNDGKTTSTKANPFFLFLFL
jgi:hypothetical protein